jgi:hypothetical protein
MDVPQTKGTRPSVNEIFHNLMSVASNLKTFRRPMLQVHINATLTTCYTTPDHAPPV